MKKLLMFSAAFVLTLTASAAAAAPSGKVTLSSDNVIGIQQVKQNKNEVVVPVTFAGIGKQGGATTLAETLYLDNLSMAATVNVMQNSKSGYYSQWIWMPGFMTDLFWTARRDGDVKVESFEQTLARGVGLRVQNSNSSTPVYTLGEYTSNGMCTTFVKEKTTYLANPYSTDLDLDAKFVSDDITPMDTLIVSDGGKELTYQYSSEGNGEGRHWYRSAIAHVIEGDAVVSKTETHWDLKKIVPGEGFRFVRGWFLSDLTIAW